MSRPSRFHAVALVGIDGSGKSTQVGMLRVWLGQHGARVLVIHPFGWKLLARLPFHERFARHGVETDSATRGHGIIWKLLAVAEVADIGIYTWAAYAYCRIWTRLVAGDVWLISDRSYDEVLAKHKQRATLPGAFLELLRYLVPTPQFTVWLNTEPQLAMQRDAEFEEGYYRKFHSAYAELAKHRRWRVIVASQLNPADVFARLRTELGLHDSPH